MYFLNWHVVVSIQLILVLCRFVFLSSFYSGLFGFFCMFGKYTEILKVYKLSQKDLIFFILILWQLCIYANI